MQRVIAAQRNLTVIEDSVTDILVDGTAQTSSCQYTATTSVAMDPPTKSSSRVTGVATENHGNLTARAVVVTSGTALRGRIFIGHEVEESGGDGRPAANRLSDSLERLGFTLTRLKTGTPPRLKASSCDFTKCIEQRGETPPPLFSLRSRCSTWNKSIACRRLKNSAGMLCRRAVSSIYTCPRSRSSNVWRFTATRALPFCTKTTAGRSAPL